jgi:hypothetical protein
VVLADQVDDHPAAIALLDVGQGERGDLRALEAAAEQDGQDGAMAQALERGWVGGVEQSPQGSAITRSDGPPLLSGSRLLSEEP